MRITRIIVWTAALLLSTVPPSEALRLNSRGEVASLSTRPQTGRETYWLTDTVTIRQAQRDGRWVLLTYDTVSKQTTEVSDQGANNLKAGGRLWAAWLSRGVRTATMLYQDAGLQDVGNDGTIALTPNYQRGTDLRLIATDGRETFVDTGATFGTRVHSAGVAAWSNSVDIKTAGTPTPLNLVPSEGVFEPRLVKLGGGWFVAYHTHRRLIFRPLTSRLGYVLSTTPNTYGIDAIALSDTKARIAWATNEAESPSSVRWADVDITAPRVDLTTGAPVVLPPVEPPPTPNPRWDTAEKPIPNHKSTVEAARRRYQTLPAGPERAYRIVNAVAWELRAEGAGMFYKKSGTNYKERSIDIVMYRDGHTFDVLGDAEGAARPQWSATSPTGRGDPKNWRAPTAPDSPEPPAPPPAPLPTTPPPTDPSTQLTALQSAFSALAARVTALDAALTASADRIATLETRLAALEARRYRGSVWGVPVTIEVVP